MLEHYSHIRSEAKQAAIAALDEQLTVPVSEGTTYKNRYSGSGAEHAGEAKLLEAHGGPAWIRTRDQRIMSPGLYR